ncbi:MAG: ABC transporter ATP-binding protein [Chlamydiales bacterium]|nr:ABC transporter ATP-binding protein [Chlamydiales bacterium]
MNFAVKCENVKKIYGDEETRVEALRGINMEARTKELLMLVGPSGCGKTTLLSVITGILSFDSGQIFLFGEEIGRMSEAEKAAFRKENIGFIFQALNLIPTWTALENISIPLILKGFREDEAYARGEEILKRVGLAHRKDALPTHMSGGEQQRVAICRGCVHEPRLIICDEPTSTLDHKTGVQVVKLIKEVAVSEEKAVILVTHDTRIYEFADRILTMEDGQILGELKE